MTLSHRIEIAAAAEGSSRPLSLVRIGVVLLLWTRWGEDLALFAAPDHGVLILGALFFAFTALLLVGYRTDFAAWGTFATLAVMYHLHGLGFAHWEWAHHHAYVLMATCLFLALGPSGRSYSVDRWLALRRAEREGEVMPAERGPVWIHLVIRLQLAALYFWAAYDKTTLPYLKGDWLARVFEWAYAGHLAYPVLTWTPLLVAASVIVLIVEYALAACILFGIMPRLALPVGIALHVVFALMLSVDTYSLSVILLYLTLLPPDAVHRFIDRMQDGGATASATAPTVKA